MTTFEKSKFKNDKVMGPVFKIVIKNHRIDEETIKKLLENKHVKDFCVDSVHFAELKNGKNASLFIHYNVSTWYQKLSKKFLVSVKSVTVYEDRLRYEAERMVKLNKN